MFALGLSVLGCGLLCATLGRFNCTAAMRSWEFFLSPAGRTALQALARDVALDGASADHAYRLSLRARERAAMDEAKRLLAIALSVIEEAVPDRLTRLQAMSICSRMAAAVLPLPALPAASFRLDELRGLMAAGAALHHLLVASVERFQLRLWILGLGLRLVLRSVRRSNAAVSGSGASEGWTRFGAGLSDFETLDREQVESFRVLVASLCTAELAPPVWESS